MTTKLAAPLGVISPTIDPLIERAARYDAMTRTEQAADIVQRMIDDLTAASEYVATLPPMPLWAAEVRINTTQTRIADVSAGVEMDEHGRTIWRSVLPQDRAHPAPRIETEADVIRPPCSDWDADDDGRGI